MTATTANIDRTPKPCTHPRANHQHGERATYKICGCRCYRCSTANSSYQVQWERAKALGKPTTSWVDAAPVREHLAKLSAAGMGRRTIAREAGIPEANLGRILYGRNGSPPSRRVNPETARRVFAVEIPAPAAAALAPHAVVDGTGTARRLQALACIGWSINRLATAGDLDRQSLDRALRGGQVFAITARAVAELYEQLWLTPPTPDAGEHRDRNGIARTIRRAQSAGWVPPADWDDESIDDPAAGPHVDVVEDQVDGDDVDEFAVELVLDGQPMTLTGPDLEAAALRLIDKGLDYAAIAARCRSDETTVRRVLNSARKRIQRTAATREEVA